MICVLWLQPEKAGVSPGSGESQGSAFVFNGQQFCAEAEVAKYLGFTQILEKPNDTGSVCVALTSQHQLTT